MIPMFISFLIYSRIFISQPNLTFIEFEDSFYTQLFNCPMFGLLFASPRYWISRASWKDIDYHIHSSLFDEIHVSFLVSIQPLSRVLQNKIKILFSLPKNVLNHCSLAILPLEILVKIFLHGLLDPQFSLMIFLAEHYRPSLHSARLSLLIGQTAAGWATVLRSL